MSETPKDLIVEVSYLLSGRTKTRTCSPDSRGVLVSYLKGEGKTQSLGKFRCGTILCSHFEVFGRYTCRTRKDIFPCLPFVV